MRTHDAGIHTRLVTNTREYPGSQHSSRSHSTGKTPREQRVPWQSSGTPERVCNAWRRPNVECDSQRAYDPRAAHCDSRSACVAKPECEGNDAVPSETVNNLLALNFSLRQALEREEDERRRHMSAREKLDERLAEEIHRAENLAISLADSERNVRSLMTMVEERAYKERDLNRKVKELSSTLEDSALKERNLGRKCGHLQATSDDNAKRERDLTRQVEELTQHTTQRESELTECKETIQELELALANLGDAKDAETVHRRKSEDATDSVRHENTVMRMRIKSLVASQNRISSEVTSVLDANREELMQMRKQVYEMENMISEVCQRINDRARK